MEAGHAEAKDEEEGSPMVKGIPTVDCPKPKPAEPPARRLLQAATPVLFLALFLLLACLGLACTLLALKVNKLVAKVNSQTRLAALQWEGRMPNTSSKEALLLQKKMQTEIAALRQKMSSDPVDEVARLLLGQTNSGGLVSKPRKLATLKLSLRALLDGVEGDFFEAGVFNGGTAVLMARVLAIYAPLRLLWAADSFMGLPVESRFGNTVAGSGSVVGAVASGHLGSRGQYASARGVFEANLRKFKLDKGSVKILQGWFKDTLPTAPVKKIAFLRADGDIYDSTRDTLEALYGKLSLGGFIYFDDYGSFAGCRRAVDEFRAKHNVSEPMMPVYENAESGVYEAVWWQKRRMLR